MHYYIRVYAMVHGLFVNDCYAYVVHQLYECIKILNENCTS